MVLVRLPGNKQLHQLLQNSGHFRVQLCEELHLAQLQPNSETGSPLNPGSILRSSVQTAFDDFVGFSNTNVPENAVFLDHSYAR